MRGGQVRAEALPVVHVADLPEATQPTPGSSRTSGHCPG